MSDFPVITPTPPDDPGQPGLKVQRSGYEISDELAGVAEDLISRHQRLAFLEYQSLVYLFNWDGPPDKRGVDDVAKARRITGWQTALTPYRGAIVVDGVTWGLLRQQQREALMLHHLLHFSTNDKTGNLEIVGHDVEEFSFVAATYGKWTPRLRDFAEQLDLRLE